MKCRSVSVCVWNELVKYEGREEKVETIRGLDELIRCTRYTTVMMTLWEKAGLILIPSLLNYLIRSLPVVYPIVFNSTIHCNYSN